jgi:hypothetical protein
VQHSSVAPCGTHECLFIKAAWRLWRVAKIKAAPTARTRMGCDLRDLTLATARDSLCEVARTGAPCCESSPRVHENKGPANAGL